MRDLFLDGLPILDALEVSGSTAAAARWINCDQSSISRAYRRVSAQLGIAFIKDDSGYQASDNLPLLASLRQAAQLRRLAVGLPLLQWICHPDLSLEPTDLGWAVPLQCSWRDQQRSLDLLQRRVLDLVLVPQQQAGERRDGITALGLEPTGGASALVRSELDGHPSIEALIKTLRSASSVG